MHLNPQALEVGPATTGVIGNLYTAGQGSVPPGGLRVDIVFSHSTVVGARKRMG